MSVQATKAFAPKSTAPHENLWVVRQNILNALKSAVTKSTIDNRMIDELNAIQKGANPRDIIGVRWDKMISERWDLLPEEELVDFFNVLA